MIFSSKPVTIVNYILSGISWLLAILCLLFNILGLWEPWHLAGFGFIYYVPVSLISQIIAIIISCKAIDRWSTPKYIILNILSAVITVGSIVLFWFVSARWFW